MKKLLLIIPLSILTLGFSGCLDNEDPVYYFTDEPAIVVYKNQEPMIKTTWGTYSTPNLSDTLKPGDCLWTNFILDMNNQSDSKNPVISGLNYSKLGLTTINSATGDMKDDYNDSILSAGIYKTAVDSVLFFEFFQKRTSRNSNSAHESKMLAPPFENGFAYKIMYNTDSVIQVNGREIPKLYIKSKRTAQSSSPNCRFAFDMSEFISKYADLDSKKVSLYLHYKTGISPEGKDIYKAFQTYPVTWIPQN